MPGNIHAQSVPKNFRDRLRADGKPVKVRHSQTCAMHTVRVGIHWHFTHPSGVAGIADVTEQLAQAAHAYTMHAKLLRIGQVASMSIAPRALDPLVRLQPTRHARPRTVLVRLAVRVSRKPPRARAAPAARPRAGGDVRTQRCYYFIIR